MKEFVENVFKEMIRTKYTHLELPQTMYAKITKGSESSAVVHTYNLKLLDENMGINEEFSEIPNVKSKDYYEVGSIVVVTLLYGKLNVFILGEVV